jgi:hypothetical protein
MSTKLALVAVSGFAISAICLGGAFALGGSAIGNAVFDMGGLDLPRCDTGSTSASTDSRSLSWDNSDRAAVALPANTHYQAGAGDQLVVKGDPTIVSHIRVHNGVVGLDCHGGAMFGPENRIDVTLPGKRSFRTFEVMGTGNMDISGLSQSEVALKVAGAGTISADAKVSKLDMDVSGTGTVEAKGKTDKLNVDVSGSGKIKAGQLETNDANLDVSGLANIEVAPQGALSINMSGAGTIYLRKEPRSIQSDISGAGHIVHPDGESQGGSRHMRHARAYGPDVDVIIQEAVASGRQPDQDELETAKIRLQQRIRARIARELAKEEWR